MKFLVNSEIVNKICTNMLIHVHMYFKKSHEQVRINNNKGE